MLYKAIEYMGRLKRSMDDTINQTIRDISKQLGEEEFKTVVQVKIEELQQMTIKNLETALDSRQ